MLDQITTETTTTAAPPPQFTEQQARDYLGTIDRTTGNRPSVRELAVAWGWSKSTVGRFLSQIEIATTSGQQRDSAPCPTAPTQKAEQGDKFDWFTDPSIVVRHEPALAIYSNPQNCVVIRRDCVMEQDSEDHFIFFSPARAEAVIEGIRRVLREIEADK